MNQLISLPMYDVHHPDTQALLKVLRQLLEEEGLEGEHAQYLQPEDRLSHWHDPRLLLSQTCGYPLRALLPEVQVVGTFNYQAVGCEGLNYSSHLMVRAEDGAKALADFRGHPVACNSDDSQSGYHCLRSLVAPLQHNGHFFSRILFTGSHRDSLAAISNHQADIAAIDAVTLALISRHEPDRVAGLVSIGTTALLPGLPMITAAQTSPADLQKLRRTLQRLASEPQWRGICEPLLINGFSVADRADYQPITDALEKAAASPLRGL